MARGTGNRAHRILGIRYTGPLYGTLRYLLYMIYLRPRYNRGRGYITLVVRPRRWAGTAGPTAPFNLRARYGTDL